MKTLRWALCAWLAVAATASAHEPDEDEHAPDTAPVPLARVEAVYPPQARAAGVSGTVALELDVDAEGNVTAVKVTRAAGFGFDESAVAAARALKFRPATHDGKPVAVTVAFEQRFTLRPHVTAETHAEGVELSPMPEAIAAAAVREHRAVARARRTGVVVDDPQSRLRAAPAHLAERHPARRARPARRAAPGRRQGRPAVPARLRRRPRHRRRHLPRRRAHQPAVARARPGLRRSALRHPRGDRAHRRRRRARTTPRCGDFATAGAVNLVTREHFDSSSVQYTLGMLPPIAGAAPSPPVALRRHRRAVARRAGRPSCTRGSPSRPPTTKAPSRRRAPLSLQPLRQAHLRSRRRAPTSALFFQAYGSGWIGSGQIPAREVDAGRISPFGSDDPSEGGAHRAPDGDRVLPPHGGEQRVRRHRLRHALSALVVERLHLLPARPGQRRRDRAGRRARLHRRASSPGTSTVAGAASPCAPPSAPKLRYDGISVTRGTRRRRTATSASASPHADSPILRQQRRHRQLNLAAYAEEDVVFTRWFRFVGALRADYFGFNVDDNGEGSAPACRHLRRRARLSARRRSAIFTPIHDLLDLYVNFGMGFHSNDAAHRASTTAARIARRQRHLPRRAAHLRRRARRAPHLCESSSISRPRSGSATSRTRPCSTPTPAASCRRTPTRRFGFDFEARARIFSWLSPTSISRRRPPRRCPTPATAAPSRWRPSLYITGGLTALRTTACAAACAFATSPIAPRSTRQRPILSAVRSTRPIRRASPPRAGSIVDAYAAYRWRFLEAQLAIQNLLDSPWREAQFGNHSLHARRSLQPDQPELRGLRRDAGAVGAHRRRRRPLHARRPVQFAIHAQGVLLIKRSAWRNRLRLPRKSWRRC